MLCSMVLATLLTKEGNSSFPYIIFLLSSGSLFARKGNTPVSRRNISTPHAQISTESSYGYCLIISGAMYDGVPQGVLTGTSDLIEYPKSINFIFSDCGSMRIFSNFRSRCNMCKLCRYSTALTNYFAIILT